MGNDRLSNGNPPTIPNGGLRCGPQEGNPRTVHDGFATIRSGAGKRGRTRSSPSVAADQKPKSCPACCNGPQSVPQGGVMEPLWEDPKGSIVTRRDPKVPWWEVATRRSKYRSCPAFSHANIVSALEQTVSDVTDRLERLASSPDLKESELEELRRSAAVLRRQSSAVSQSVSSGYFSLERQASCDSVSSVSSSISNATHLSFNSVAPRIPPHQHIHPEHHFEEHIHHSTQINTPDNAKTKKRNWLRASFKRAFGKQKRKRNPLMEEQSSRDGSISRGSTAPHTHSSISHSHIPFSQSKDPSNRYFSCSSIPRERDRTHSFSDMCKEHRNRETGSSQLESLDRLQVLLLEKEKALGETKAELLVAQGQIQKQSELITKLQTESNALKEENCRLLSLVEKKFGSLPTSSLTPLLNNMESLSISATTGNYATVQRKGKRIKILVIENISVENATDVTDVSVKESECIFTGCAMILPKTTWEELDNNIAEIFEDYCSRLDPGSSLSLGRESLFCYKLGEAVRGENLPHPDLLPYGYCVGNVDGLYLWLKGPLQKDGENPHGSVASICFSNSLPAPTLRNLLNLLQETRRIMLVGPPSCGKTSIARQLARGFTAGKGLNPDEGSIIFFTVNENNALDLCQLLTSIWPLGRATLLSHKTSFNDDPTTNSCSVPPQVLVIDDIQAASGVVETLQRCLPLSTQASPVVIATSTNAPSIVTRLQVHCYFRWVGFSLQEEPVRGLLGRILRRPLLAAEDTSGLSLPVVHRTVDWLTRLWLHLNSLISGCGADTPLGPTVLADCPMDQEEAKIWFTWKWNDCLAPKVEEILKTGLVGHWADPKEWIVSTYPWTKDASVLAQLKSIKPEKEGKNSPSFRTKLSQRSAQSTSIKPQLRSLDSPRPLRPLLEKRLNQELNKTNEDQKSTNSEIKTDKMLPFSTFLKSSVDNLSKPLHINRDYNKIKIDTFKPLLYRRDHNMNGDFLLKTEKDKNGSDPPTNEGEHRKFNFLHAGILKEVSL